MEITGEQNGTQLAVPPGASLADPLAEKVRGYVRAAKAPATVRAYRSDWTHFKAWCTSRELPPLPATPETVALYLAAFADERSAATLARRLTSIARAHETAGFLSPATMRHAVVSETLKGIRRVHGVAQVRKAPLMTADIQAVLAPKGEGLIELRDRALVLITYCGAFRRSETPRLHTSDLEWRKEGIVATLRRSKTDQQGQGRDVAIPRGAHPSTCPVRALEAWMKAAEIDRDAVSRPIFCPVDRHGNVALAPLHPNSVGEIIKRGWLCARDTSPDPTRGTRCVLPSARKLLARARRPSTS